jgi:hypothetical protein
MAECSVLCVGTQSGTPLKLDHVLIPPDAPSGLSNFSENLPRGSSNVVDGSEYEESLVNIDPHTLDGDWCIVSFMGGNLDRPYISSWWQHPRNNLDPATSGQGNPDPQGMPQAIDQSYREFRRTRGVEYIVTSEGDVYLSTEFANSALKFGTDLPTIRGGWNKTTNPEVGGSVNVRLKQSQTLELDWNPSTEGIGINRGVDPNLPQRNPTSSQEAPKEATFTTLFVSKDDLVLKLPSIISLSSGSSLNLSSEDTATLTGKNLLELEGSQIKAGANADQPAIRGEDLLQWLSNLTVLTATGPAKINPLDIASFINPSSGTPVKSTKFVVE